MIVSFEPDRLAVCAAIFTICAFVIRELAAGVLREAGQDAWRWAKRHTRIRTYNDRP
jgi:hypothetical protein